jgi:tetratricopeptide (TPR) repeat protein
MRSLGRWGVRLVATVSFVAGLAITAAGDDLADCGGSDSDPAVGVAGCNRLLQSGSLQGDALLSVYVSRGNHYRRQSDYDHALADYNEVLRLANGKYSAGNAYTGRAFVYIETGQRELAASDLNNAIHFYGEWIAREPARWLHYMARASTYTLQGDYELAIADYDAAIRIDQSAANLIGLRGAVNFYKGDTINAYADSAESLRLNPNNAFVHTMLGRIYELTGQFDYAITEHDNAIRIDPKVVQAYANRGRAYAAKSDHDRANADFETALQLNPNAGILYIYPGILLEQGGRLDRALAEFQAALRLNPTLISALKGQDRVRAAIAAGNGRK